METLGKTVTKRSIQEWREIFAADRQARLADWREHWPSIVLHGLLECGGGFAFGVALGLAAVVSVLTQALRNF